MQKKWFIIFAAAGLFVLSGIILMLVSNTSPEQNTPTTQTLSGTAGLNTTPGTSPTGEAGSTAQTSTALSNLAENKPTHSIFPSESTGVIEGSLSYPSSGIPAAIKVCAVNQETFQEYCTQDHISHESYPYGKGYRLEVAPGEYTVYAQLPGEDYRAYYTQFVLCGNRVECQDHQPIRVTVTANSITNHVDPQDWYDTPEYR